MGIEREPVRAKVALEFVSLLFDGEFVPSLFASVQMVHG
jgi:hypothetical protein